MIICSLEAENLLKYRALRLSDLPERGVIAVSGDNETGKSAIGEIICFALFGRTYSLDPGDLRKLVRWGATRGRLSLKFSARDRNYEITRHLDRGGEQSARLVLCEKPEEPIARGMEAVSKEVEGLLGYDFGEYIESFYLAQREITTPHPHSPAIKRMVGTGPLELCARELLQEIGREEESARLLEDKLRELQGEAALLGPERLRVEDLEQELLGAEAGEQELRARIEGLDAAVEDYCDACEGLRAHAFRRGLASLTGNLLLLMGLIFAGAWVLLRFRPGLWPLPAVREHLEGLIASTGLQLETILVFAGVGIIGMLILSWLWTLALNLGSKRRRARGRRLGDELRLVDEMEPGEPLPEPEISEDALAAGDVPMEAPTLVDKPDSERRARLEQRVRALDASSREVRAAARHETAWMERRSDALSEKATIVAKTLENARTDREKGDEFKEKGDDLTRKLAEHRSGIATRRLACELLDGAVVRMADRFNDHLRTLMGRNLPRFTDGRYEHLQVGEDLQVRVYSNEKRNFLDLEETSSGTQRQIMLALRLALAQELVAEVARDRQFAFLDEPFAFFDDTRMRGALRMLPELSEGITQYWVVAQRFPRDEFLALEIPCGGNPDTLELGPPMRPGASD